MSKKVRITIAKGSLDFSYCNNQNTSPDLLNTNVISHDELMFSSDYLEKNKKIVSSFLDDLSQEMNIHKIIISDYSLAFIVIDIISKIACITEMFFLDDDSLPFDLCEKIIDNKSLKYINCSSIPPFMVEMLDRNNLHVETRCEVLFTSTFMETNSLTQYSKMYYKTNLRIENEFNDLDFADFEAFCKINRYLKTIHLYIVNSDLIEKMVSILHKYRFKHIKILLHKNINDPAVAEEFRKLNKTYKAKYNISLKIVYSENYLKDNIAKQVVLNILKTCAIVVVIISGAVFGTIIFNNYLSEKKVDKITAEIRDIIKESEEKPLPDGQKISNKYMALLEINPDTIGWLKVKDTKIDYPVVKTTNNDYYLNHGYQKEKDYAGWIFMDYRNSFETLGKNTIIYGHNRYQSGIVFGTLDYTTKKDWFTNSDNLIIEFETIYEELKWQIFSIYKINNTTDYIQTHFDSDKDFGEFISLIQDRSLHDFGVDINPHSKILTLSTCLDNNRRLVVHAFLLNK